MNQGYSLRAAAKIVGIAHTTFDNYKKRGIVTPDVADKNGEFSLFSEAQIELAKAYRAANPPKTKSKTPATRATISSMSTLLTKPLPPRWLTATRPPMTTQPTATTKAKLN